MTRAAVHGRRGRQVSDGAGTAPAGRRDDATGQHRRLWRGTRQHGRRTHRASGTPGQARAQQLAGLALNNHERARVAERALAGCVLDWQATGLLTDASLCHGWAGVVQALWRATNDALDSGPLQVALRTARRGMEDQLARMGPPASSGSWKEGRRSAAARMTCGTRRCRCG